jgi:hypothetical protein
MTARVFPQQEPPLDVECFGLEQKEATSDEKEPHPRRRASPSVLLCRIAVWCDTSNVSFVAGSGVKIVKRYNGTIQTEFL